MRLLAAILLSIGAMTAQAAPEIKGTPDELRQLVHPVENRVMISGEAQEKAYTDKAIVSVVVTTEEKQLAKSLAANAALRSSIQQQLLKAGIAADAIKSSKFSTSPQYGWFGSKPDSYKVVNRMAITISEEKHMEAIATAADAHKEIEVSSTEFEHTQKDEFDQKVKAAALAKIMATKKNYEKTLGITLKPVAIRDSRIFQRASVGARGVEEVLVTAQRKMKTSATMADESSFAPTPSSGGSSFDEIVYEAFLEVEFKVE